MDVLGNCYVKVYSLASGMTENNKNIQQFNHKIVEHRGYSGMATCNIFDLKAPIVQ